MSVRLLTGNNNKWLYFSNKEVHFQKQYTECWKHFWQYHIFQEKLLKIDNLQNSLKNAVKNESWAAESSFRQFWEKQLETLSKMSQFWMNWTLCYTLSKMCTELSKVIQLKLRLVHAEYPFSKAIYRVVENYSDFLILFKTLFKLVLTYKYTEISFFKLIWALICMY